MNILYIEDDLVDQMMFKRLCTDLDADIKVDVIDSVAKLKEGVDLSNYCLVFSDIFLPDGDVNDVLTLIAGEDLIILSGETDPAFLKTYINKPYSEVFNKPLDKSLLKELIEKKQKDMSDNSSSPQISAEDYQAIKLSNLQRLSKGDTKDMVDLMDIALDLLPQRIEELSTGFQEKDWKQVHFSAHAAKSVSRLVGIPVYDGLGELDRKARLDDPDPEELFSIYQELLPVLEKAYEELTHLKEKLTA